MTETRRVGTDLDAEQLTGLTDMDPEAFRAAGPKVVAGTAASLAGVGRSAVSPNVEPGATPPLFAATPPEAPEPLAAILDDYARLVEPNVTHWQHPGFFAYFA